MTRLLPPPSPARPPRSWRERGRSVLEMTRFASVGLINSGIDTGVFAALHWLAGWPLPLANTAGFLVAVINSYLLNGAWTFRRPGHPAFAPSLRQGALFALANLGGLVVSTVVLVALAPVMPVLAAKACAIGAGFVWNYGASRRLFVARAAG
ncbi:GtrA family protein [Pararhodospirillum oryzae]|uniref:GtrA/DPMS transmembrane domain-containing protein n=1 Tax=Pararhodospirillum oryzae TaxID=478448 RepID=A0A512H5N8_9PROT|nr:GtrA family protein [Pararhodospirillum oryzae]GEO80786.1 hypothetical protein ROR02_09170 [Pararhodospirillum oryzae]